MKLVVNLPIILATFCTATAINSVTASQSQAATPVCVSAASDGDGDGWGWENHRSCLVTDQTSSDPITNNTNNNNTDNNTVTSPSSSRFPSCTSTSADPDGDGWGWESNRSCIVSVTTQSGTTGNGQTSNSTNSDTSNNTTTATTNSNGHPPCSSPSFDEDGDGWGYENYRSCIVVNDTDESDDSSNTDTTADDEPTTDNSNDNTDNATTDNDIKDEDSAEVIYSQQFSSAAEGLYQGDQLNAGWNTPFWHLGFDQGRVAIVRDTAGHGNVMKVTYPAGAFGANGASAFLSDVQFGMGLPKSYNELYLSYDIKFGDNFEFVLGGKLPGLCGSDVNQAPSTGCNTGGGYPSGFDGWSARSMWRIDGAMENYVYHAGQQNYYGDDELWDVKAQPGRWHRIQHRIVLNTVGQNNGILEAWFDNVKVLSADDFVYRKTASVGINLFYFSTFFGGNDSSWAPSTDQHILFDNFVISTTPIR